MSRRSESASIGSSFVCQKFQASELTKTPPVRAAPPPAAAGVPRPAAFPASVAVVSLTLLMFPSFPVRRFRGGVRGKVGQAFLPALRKQECLRHLGGDDALHNLDDGGSVRLVGC